MLGFYVPIGEACGQSCVDAGIVEHTNKETMVPHYQHTHTRLTTYKASMKPFIFPCTVLTLVLHTTHRHKQHNAAVLI